jgi:hypothetical protein
MSAQVFEGQDTDTIERADAYIVTIGQQVQQLVGYYANAAQMEIGSGRPVLASAVEAAIGMIAMYEAGARVLKELAERGERAGGDVSVTPDDDTVLFYTLMCATKVMRSFKPKTGEKPRHFMIDAAEMLAAIKGDVPLPGWVIELRDTCTAALDAHDAAREFPTPVGRA